MTFQIPPRRPQSRPNFRHFLPSSSSSSSPSSSEEEKEDSHFSQQRYQDSTDGEDQEGTLIDERSRKGDEENLIGNASRYYYSGTKRKNKRGQKKERRWAMLDVGNSATKASTTNPTTQPVATQPAPDQGNSWVGYVAGVIIALLLIGGGFAAWWFMTQQQGALLGGTAAAISSSLAATSDTGNNTTASSTTNNSSATASPVTPTDIASISMGNIATSAADISDSPLENVSTMNSTNDDYPSSVDDSAPTQISTDNSGESDLNDDGDSGDSEDSNEGPTSTAQDTPTDSNDGLTSVSQDSPAPTYSVVTVTLVSATEVAVSRSRLGSDGSKNHSATAAIQTITATSLDPKSNSTTNATESFLATIPDSCQSFCVDYPYAVEACETAQPGVATCNCADSEVTAWKTCAGCLFTVDPSDSDGTVATIDQVFEDQCGIKITLTS